MSSFDLHDLDVRINDSGVNLSAIDAALASLIAAGRLTLAETMMVLTPMRKLTASQIRIQEWSTEAQRPVVVTPPAVVVAQPAPPTEQAPHLEEQVKLARLTGTLLTRLMRAVATAQYDQSVADELGANYNAYVNAYSSGGYYYDPALFGAHP